MDHQSAGLWHLQLPSSSDLAHGFGAGPTPAEDLAARGATSTVWTIHQVIEAVDAGPVVAVSPEINVLNLSGALPADPLVLDQKLTEPVGCLGACFVDALARRFAAGTPGPVDTLEPTNSIPAAVLARMAAPIGAERHVTTLPAFDPAQLASFR